MSILVFFMIMTMPFCKTVLLTALYAGIAGNGGSFYYYVVKNPERFHKTKKLFQLCQCVLDAREIFAVFCELGTFSLDNGGGSLCGKAGI